MKTIKQIADEIGVSRQAIHKRIKQEPLSTRLTGMLSTVDNRLTVSVDGETLIKQAFEQNPVNQSCQAVDETSTDPVNQVDTSSTRVDTSSTTVDSEIIDLLQKNIEILQTQLQIKDKQIESLTAIVNTQAESINVERKNLLAETLIAGKDKLEEPEVSPKKAWQFWKK